MKPLPFFQTRWDVVVTEGWGNKLSRSGDLLFKSKKFLDKEKISPRGKFSLPILAILNNKL